MDNQEIAKIETPTTGMLIWKQDWQAALRTIKVNSEMTFFDLRKLDTPSIKSMVVDDKNNMKGVNVFLGLIISLLKFFDAVWTDEQIKNCSELWYEEAGHLTFAELSSFAQKAKSGKFEKVFGKFTPLVFTEWFSSFLQNNNNERKIYFGKSTWMPPENPVSDEKFSALVRSLENELKVKKTEKSNQRLYDIEKHQDFLKLQYEKREKSKTKIDRQVPDSCENDIPNE